MDFIKKHLNDVIALGPRTEALETPILDPVKKTSSYGWSEWDLIVDETRQQ